MIWPFGCLIWLVITWVWCSTTVIVADDCKAPVVSVQEADVRAFQEHERQEVVNMLDDCVQICNLEQVLFFFLIIVPKWKMNTNLVSCCILYTWREHVNVNQSYRHCYDMQVLFSSFTNHLFLSSFNVLLLIDFVRNNIYWDGVYNWWNIRTHLSAEDSKIGYRCRS